MNRVKKWMREHQSEVALASLITTAVCGVVIAKKVKTKSELAVVDYRLDKLEESVGMMWPILQVHDEALGLPEKFLAEQAKKAA